MLDKRLGELDIRVLDISREAAYLASKAFVQYRRQGGKRIKVLPDFFIGAHATVLACPLLTRDRGTYSTYFPGVQLIAP
jgi:predicted nucleic acid-binding protein